MAKPQEPAVKPRVVRCPTCGGDSVRTHQSLPPVLQRTVQGRRSRCVGQRGFPGPDEAPPDDLPFGDPKEQ